MEFRYLKAFLLTAKHASFSKAAYDLNIAQSAVSRQIKLLEESLGHELIIRSSKRVLLTDKGRDLYLATGHFEDSMRDIFITDSDKTIKLGVLDGLVNTWLNSFLIEYYSEYSNNISITIDSPLKLKALLANGDLDVIFTTENIQSELISSLKLIDERLVLISKGALEPTKAHLYRWIVFTEDDPIFQAFKKKSPHILTVDSMATIINMVKNKVGIAVVPDHTLRSEDELDWQIVKGLRKSEIYMATLNFKSMPQYLKRLTNLILKRMKKNLNKIH